MNIIKIGYFADGPWAHSALQAMLTDSAVEVSFICVRFDNPDDYLLKQGERNGIPSFSLKNVNSTESLAVLDSLKVDLFVSMSFNQIFKSAFLSTAPLGVLNCHAGKLPFYRGRNILNWALINGENEFGITVHQVDEGIDTGDIVIQKTFPIGINDNYGSLLEVAYRECAPILIEAIHLTRLGTSKLVRQNEISLYGTYFTQRVAGDERINWNQSSWNIHNFIRALALPGPQAETNLKGQIVKVKVSKFIEGLPKFIGIPGSVIGVSNEGIAVKTADTYIVLIDYVGYLNPRIGDRFL
jgi:methionyl-tRNA formyltransferase